MMGLGLKTLNSFQGKVIRGLQIGAKFGIATANLKIIGHKPNIEEGVYYCKCRMSIEKDQVSGILHIGELKTFGREKTCEVHLLNFDQEIYGEVLEIDVLKFVRPTIKFQNADLLYTQIEHDVIGAEKYFLRQTVYQQWNGLTEIQKEVLAQKAVDKISRRTDFLSAETIYIYAPQKDREIDFTKVLMGRFPEKNYFFPKIMGDEEMVFCEIKNYSDLVIGTFGILEPKLVNDQLRSLSNTPLPKGTSNEKPDLIFIPSVAVDLDGYRLGKGGGFYDRWLASAEHEKMVRIAVMPKFSVVEKIPIEAHDEKVDVIVEV